MTVTYTGQVANAKLCAFSRLLLYWRGSIYKLVYKEMVIFMVLYTACSLVYRFLLHPHQKRIFEHIVLYCETFTSLIPLSFVLGFYVAIVVTRWWNQFMCIPWPDRVMMYVSTLVEGVDERSRMIRRTLMRYLTLSSLMVFQSTSVSVKKRFPTEDHLIEAGVMTVSDKKTLDQLSTPHGKWWVPFTWCFNIIKEARQEGKITDDFLLKTVMEEILSFRTNLGTLYSYDWISIPLVYTQVTTLAVYSFFLGCVLGRQFLDPAQGYPGHDVDLVAPVFTLLQFFFYMGWLKVAEQMINPFGEDDDDFDMNWIIDRNLQVSLLTVDNMYMQYPMMEKDMYWDEHPPECLPYTKSALASLRQPFMGSTADVSVSDEGMQIVNPMETINEDGPLELPYHNHINQVCDSPIASPCRTPRPAHRHLTNLYTQASASKLTLGSTHNLERPFLQTLSGPSAKHNLTYLESWLKDANLRTCSKMELAHPPDALEATPFRPRSGSSHAIGVRHSVAGVESPLCASTPTQPPVVTTQSVYCLTDQPPTYMQSLCHAPSVETHTPHTPTAHDTVIDMPAVIDTSPAVVETVAIRGSNGSIHEYALSDSSNSTVNSMAPLLKDYTPDSMDV